jgi:hypothetical protein
LILTPGGYMICVVTLLSGVATGLVITLLRRKQILKVLQLARAAFFVVGVGSATQCIAGRPPATAETQMFTMMTLASVLFLQSNQKTDR